LGGTFDPIHLGHLRAAENARESLALDRVYFVPAHTPPHRGGPGASPLDRYAMVALAVAGHPAFVASAAEIERRGPTYTVDTIHFFREAHRDCELYLIVGADTFPEMATWREAERLFAACKVAVVPRPGPERPAPVAPFPGALGVAEVAGEGLPLSATLIRQRLLARASVRYLVPDAVADYIEKRGLYS
jgi:nicotinate-nucleotide adenylyltransferase